VFQKDRRLFETPFQERVNNLNAAIYANTIASCRCSSAVNEIANTAGVVRPIGSGPEFKQLFKISSNGGKNPLSPKSDS
jgi:hypothetical protein